MSKYEEYDPDTKILYDHLYEFIKESIPILRKNIDINSIPTKIKYEIKEIDGREKILRNPLPNWGRSSSYLEPISNLPSLHMAMKICNDYNQFNSLNGMYAQLFNAGTTFNSNNIPIRFLTDLINQENGFHFRKKTFEVLFQNLLNYTSSDKLSCHIVVPLDNFSIKQKSLQLDQDVRLRNLKSQELVDFINHYPFLSGFYGIISLPWFDTILEFDIDLNIDWFTQQDKSDPNLYLRKINKSDPSHIIKSKINQELVILRTFFKYQISSPTYIVDYNGWDPSIYRGGPVITLPWTRPYSFIQNQFVSNKMIKFRTFRNKFYSMRDDYQQRVFIAMRRFAFSMDKAYRGDRIMDNVAGLEGLLVDGKNEVSHKFAERIAILLEKNPTERINLIKEMKTAYGLRSSVAHGSIVADDFDKIVTLIKSGKPPKSKLINEFDELQQLEPKVKESLYNAIIICINKQTTDFKWDLSLMSTKVKPFESES